MRPQPSRADIMQGARLNHRGVWLAAVVTDFDRQFLWL